MYVFIGTGSDSPKNSELFYKTANGPVHPHAPRTLPPITRKTTGNVIVPADSDVTTRLEPIGQEMTNEAEELKVG